MPNIRQFTSGVDSLTPTDRGSTALAIAGGRVASAYDSAGNDLARSGRALGDAVSGVGSAIEEAGKKYVEHVTTTQMLHALDLAAKAQAAAAQDWNQTMAADAASDTHDPALADKWQKDKLAPSLDAIGATFSTKEGQEWWAQHRVQVQQHFTETTAADMSTLAGVQAVQNFTNAGNSAQSLAYNDPTSANLARGTMEAAQKVAIRSLGANASPSAVAAIMREGEQQSAAITVAQGRGAVDASPDPVAAAKAFMASPEAVTHLDDNQRAAINGYAETVARSNDTRAKAAQVQAQKAEDDQAEAVSTQISAGLIGADGTIAITPQAVEAFHRYAQMPGALRNSGQVRALGNMIEAHAGAEQKHDKDDPTTYSDFVQRATLPEGDPRRLTKTEIFQANANFLISDRFMNQLQEQIKPDSQSNPGQKLLDENLTRYFASVKKTFTGTDPKTGETDLDGDRKFYNFQFEIRRQAAARVAAGDSPEAVNRAMLDPTSTIYVGLQAPLFLKTGQSAAAYNAEHAATGAIPPVLGTPPAAKPQAGRAPAPGAVAWKPGESWEAYLKRTGQ